MTQWFSSACLWDLWQEPRWDRTPWYPWGYWDPDRTESDTVGTGCHGNTGWPDCPGRPWSAAAWRQVPSEVNGWQPSLGLSGLCTSKTSSLLEKLKLSLVWFSANNNVNALGTDLTAHPGGRGQGNTQIFQGLFDTISEIHKYWGHKPPMRSELVLIGGSDYMQRLSLSPHHAESSLHANLGVISSSPEYAVRIEGSLAWSVHLFCDAKWDVLLQPDLGGSPWGT